MITLVLGGAKSGKSLYAEKIAIQSQKKLIYIATAQAYDNEMEQRIILHQHRRIEQNVNWHTIEEPIALANLLEQFNKKVQTDNHYLVLIDCLTLWLTNLLCKLDQEQRQLEIDAFLDLLSHSQLDIILVSNETGLGIVPMDQLSRQFIDLAGSLHQQIALLADRVILTVAGLPLTLKGIL